MTGKQKGFLMIFGALLVTYVGSYYLLYRCGAIVKIASRDIFLREVDPFNPGEAGCSNIAGIIFNPAISIDRLFFRSPILGEWMHGQSSVKIDKDGLCSFDVPHYSGTATGVFQRGYYVIGVWEVEDRIHDFTAMTVFKRPNKIHFKIYPDGEYEGMSLELSR